MVKNLRVSAVLSLFRKKNTRISPLLQERVNFVQEVREQFLQLKEKGLGITVFTV